MPRKEESSIISLVLRSWDPQTKGFILSSDIERGGPPELFGVDDVCSRFNVDKKALEKALGETQTSS